MAKSVQRAPASWPPREVVKLRSYADRGFSTWEAGKCLDRTQAAVERMAQRLGIEFHGPMGAPRLNHNRHQAWLREEMQRIIKSPTLNAIDRMLREWEVPLSLWQFARTRGLSPDEFLVIYEEFLVAHYLRKNRRGPLLGTPGRARHYGYQFIRQRVTAPIKRGKVKMTETGRQVKAFDAVLSGDC